MTVVDNRTSPALALSWWDQREARARAVLNYARAYADKPIRFNYALTPPALTGTNKANQDKTFNGVVFKFDQAGAQNLIDSPPTIPITAAPFKVDNTVTLTFPDVINQPKTTSWYVAKEFQVASVLDGNYCLPLCLDQDGPGGASYIEVGWSFSDSPSHPFLYMGGGTGTAKVDLGAGCAIGSALVPTNVRNTVGVGHDKSQGQLFVEFNDVRVLTLSANTLGSTNLDAMPTAALALDTQNNDGLPALRIFGGFAMVRGNY